MHKQRSVLTFTLAQLHMELWGWLCCIITVVRIVADYRIAAAHSAIFCSANTSSALQTAVITSAIVPQLPCSHWHCIS